MMRILLAFTWLWSSIAFGATITSLAGDRDSFGTGLPDGSPVSVAQILEPGGEEGDFDQWNLPLFSWIHMFDLGGQTIVSAMLTIATLDVEDNGAGDGQGGGPFDTTLLLDGTEVPGAFDDVFTADGTAQTLLTPNVTVFDLAGFFDVLTDGMVDVVVNPRAGSRGDGISIDYAELTIVTRSVSVPEPATFLLSLSGLFGLWVSRSRRLRREPSI